MISIDMKEKILDLIKSSKEIGITAGASTPQNIINRVMDEPVVEEAVEEKTRRATPIATAEEGKTRRTNLPKYNVVNIKTN